MDSYLNYGAAYLNFFGSLIFAAAAVLPLAVYRMKRKQASKPGRILLSVLGIANVLYVFINLSSNVLNSTDSWFSIWAFVFLPCSLILAVTIEAGVNHLRDIRDL